jgi:hypothetical protein
MDSHVDGGQCFNRRPVETQSSEGGRQRCGTKPPDLNHLSRWNFTTTYDEPVTRPQAGRRWYRDLNCFGWLEVEAV